jgi:hypothetical protein
VSTMDLISHMHMCEIRSISTQLWPAHGWELGSTGTGGSFLPMDAPWTVATGKELSAMPFAWRCRRAEQVE